MFADLRTSIQSIKTNYWLYVEAYVSVRTLVEDGVSVFLQPTQAENTILLSPER